MRDGFPGMSANSRLKKGVSFNGFVLTRGSGPPHASGQGSAFPRGCSWIYRTPLPLAGEKTCWNKKGNWNASFYTPGGRHVKGKLAASDEIPTIFFLTRTGPWPIQDYSRQICFPCRPAGPGSCRSYRARGRPEAKDFQGTEEYRQPR